jgi:hypothetical protein
MTISGGKIFTVPAGTTLNLSPGGIVLASNAVFNAKGTANAAPPSVAIRVSSAISTGPDYRKRDYSSYPARRTPVETASE